MGPNSTSASKNIRGFRKLLSNAEVTKRDPWHLPPVFYLTRENGSFIGLHTDSGYWSHSVEFTGIRSEASSSSSTIFPDYDGVRKTMEFYLRDGTKTDWVIHEYNLLHRDQSCHKKQRDPFLFLKDGVVICKVFKKDATHETSSPPSSRRTVLTINGESSNAADVGTIHLCKQLQDEVNSLLESAEGDTHEKSDDDVWQHFTKIRTKNPGVMYAVCHHCDKALKADCSKKDCIAQLERHRESDKCRSSRSNPSTDEDREMLRHLRAVREDLSGQQRMDGMLECQEINTHLTQQNPWVLGHNTWYVTTSLNRETDEGCWEEIDEEFTGIRSEQQPMQGFWMELGKENTSMIQNDYQMKMQAPLYMGLRRTLEFHHIQKGIKIKTGWIMLEYQQLDDNSSAAMFLQGDMVIRKVLPYDKDAVTAIFNDFGRRLNGDTDNEEHYNGEGINLHGGGDRKRKRSDASKRTSKVWVHFTEIRTADHDVVYAVCHNCDRCYGSARSTNGTSHLGRHTESCTKKLRRTENAKDITTEWNAQIWPRFLVLKNYLETEPQPPGMC